MGGEIGRRIQVTIQSNLLVLDVDRDFLLPFERRTESGGYIGLGKLIMASVRLAAHGGDPRVLAFKDRLVARTIAAQQSDGYIGICRPADRITALWDVHELGYLIDGLVDDSLFFDRPASLAAARRAADYLLANWDRVPGDWAARTGVAAFVAATGSDRALLALYRATGDERYLDFLLQRRGLARWDMPLVIGRRPGIEGHIYGYMARTLAQLELYRRQPSPVLLKNANRALQFLTAANGATITGGAGQWEIWTGDQDGRAGLAETCATAYQLRVYNSLLQLQGDPRLGDLMERTIHNTLFAAQSPDGRRIRYFTPLEGPRRYHPTDAYCCPNNYRRIVAELPEMIYYRSQGGLVVNLYTESELRTELVGSRLHLEQKTLYPADGRVLIRLDPAPAVQFPLRLRIPLWAAGARVKVNGVPVEGVRPGEFLLIQRLWKPGDTVELELPLRFRLVRGRRRQAGRVAVMRGPLVYTLNPKQSEALAKLDAAELTAFTLDPASLHLLPDGACRAGLWKPGFGLAATPDYQVKLTPFPDPAGEACYFRLRDPSAAVDDELLR